MALSSARSLKGMMDDGRMPLICCASYTDAEKKAPLSRVPLVKGCCTPRDTCYRPRKGPFRWMDETELRRWNVRVIQSQVDLVLKTLSKSNIFITLGADLVERFYCALLEEPCPLFHRVLLLPVEERTLVQIEASYPTTMGHLDHCLGLSRLEIQLDTRETFLARYSPMLLTRATPLVPEQHQLLLFEVRPTAARRPGGSPFVRLTLALLTQHGEGLLPLYKVQLLQNAICRLSLVRDAPQTFARIGTQHARHSPRHVPRGSFSTASPCRWRTSSTPSSTPGLV